MILKTKDNLAANFVTNSWCVVSAGATSSSDLAEYTTAFKDFYDDMAGLIGNSIAQNGHEIKWYDLPGPGAPNYPIEIDVWNLAANPTTASLPHEVAVGLSFQGLKIPGQPQSRRRGRIYFGPLTNTANDDGRPSSATRSTLATAAATLTSNLKAASVPGTLSVWSQVDAAAVTVVDGWVDNSFDTQRRRGVQPTTRQTWVAA